MINVCANLELKTERFVGSRSERRLLPVSAANKPPRCGSTADSHKTVVETREERLQAGRPVGSGWMGAVEGSVPTRVERFDRQGTEPFELLRSEFDRNSFKLQGFREKIQKVRTISTLSKISAKFKFRRKFRQKL